MIQAMNAEQHIEECRFRHAQIQLYDPDPTYVANLLVEFSISADHVFDSIFEEADNSFGLFVKDKITEHSFRARAVERNDQKALEFCEWFAINYINEHKMSYPSFIDKVRQFIRCNGRSPTVKTMMIAQDRYHDDPAQEIIDVHGRRVRSKIDVQSSMRRQMTSFLMIINNKRTRAREPQVTDNQVISTTFAEIEDTSMEIVYATRVYIPMMVRIKDESRLKINEFRS